MFLLIIFITQILALIHGQLEIEPQIHRFSSNFSYTGLKDQNRPKDLDYYMEDEDRIYDRPWRQESLEPEEKDYRDERSCFADLESPDAYDAHGVRKPLDHIRKHFSKLNEYITIINIYLLLKFIPAIEVNI